MTAPRGRMRSAIAAVRAFAAALPVAARSMRRNPGFFLVAVSSLAVALGLSTTVFAHIDSLTHPFVPVRDIDHLYSVWVPGDGAIGQPTGDEVAELVRRVPSFSGVAAESGYCGVVEAGDKGGQLCGQAVDANYFTVMGLRPRLGRLFSPAETAESGVVILSDALWKLLFDNREEIGTAVVTYEGRPYSVVGVLPDGLEKMVGTAFWLPRPQHVARYAYYIARLKGGATVASARASLQSLVAAPLLARYGTGRTRFAAAMRASKPDPLRLSEYHGAMIGAAACILVIACANVAALMLARGTVKRRDQALRLSLGATRTDLLTGVAAEVCIIAAVGGLAGMLLTSWTMHLLTGAVHEDIARIGVVELHWSLRVFAESFAAMVAAITLAASLPAWYASRILPSEPLKESSGTTTGRAGSRFRVLVVAEIAISMVLLVGSSLMAKATRNVADFNFGYDARPLLVASANVGIKPDSAAASIAKNNKEATKRTEITVTQFMAAIERVRAAKGVLAATGLLYGIPDKNLVISDQVDRGATPLNIRHYLDVGPGFLRTLGIPMVEGRDFVEGDRAGRGGVILDQRAAKQLFPHGGAVGQLVKLGDERSARPWVPVVGVARNARLEFPVEAELEPDPVVYVSLPIGSTYSADIIVRPRGGALWTAAAVLTALKAELPPRAFVMTYPWLHNYESMLALREFTAEIFIGLGIASLALAAAGLFSVLSYSVGQRMREFAVRVALGASGRDMMQLVMADGVVMALGGTAIGALVGMWAGFLLNSFLWGVYPADAGALVLAEAILFAVTMASCVAPALKATRADPLAILRAT